MHNLSLVAVLVLISLGPGPFQAFCKVITMLKPSRDHVTGFKTFKTFKD